jgi:hypothetical protein
MSFSKPNALLNTLWNGCCMNFRTSSKFAAEVLLLKKTFAKLLSYCHCFGTDCFRRLHFLGKFTHKINKIGPLADP